MNDTTHQSIVSISSNYSTMMLITLSLLGVIGKLFNDLIKEKQQIEKFVWVDYWSKEYPSLAFSFIICVVVIIIRHEMLQVPDFSNWEGATMALLGYFGSSALSPLFDFINFKFKIK
jgi:hypothetical protein